MATANILFNSSSPPVLNYAITNVIALTNANNAGVTAWQWQLLDKPAGSSATLSTPTTSTSSITLDKEGSYLIRLTINNGAATTTAVMAVPNALSGIRLIASGEKLEGDSARGWASTLNTALSEFESDIYAGSVLTCMSTAVMSAGVPVRFTGETTLANGDKIPTVAAAHASSLSTLPGIGVTTATTSINGITLIRTAGPLVEATLNTTGSTVGSPVFISNSGTLSLISGSISNIIGYVQTVSSTGRVFVSPSKVSTQSYNVKFFGAVGDAVHDDTSAIQSAIAAAAAAGGGVVTFTNTGRLYRITNQLLHGVRFVDEGDVTLTALGYPNGSYSASLAASWDTDAAAAANQVPHIGFDFEPGAGIWTDFAPGSETAAIYYGAQPNGASANNGNMQNGFIRGAVICAQDQYSAGGFVVVGGTTAVTNNVSGIFVPGVSQLRIENITGWGLNRGITTSDNYWGEINHCEFFRCNDGITAFDMNASILYNNLVSYAHGTGFIVTGQGFRLLACWGEGNNVDLNIPTADSWHLTDTYFENDSADPTDYCIKLGQNGNGVNVTWGAITNLTVIRGVNSPHIHYQSVFGCTTTAVRIRFATSTNRSRVETNCTDLVFVGCNLPLDSDSITNSLHLCSFVSSAWDVSGVGSQFTWQTTGPMTVQGSLAAQGEFTTGAARNRNFQNVNGTVTLGNTHDFVVVQGSGGPSTLTLPQTSTCPGREYILQRDGSTPSNDATIVTHSGDDFIFPSGTPVVGTSMVLKPLQSIKMISWGGNGFWWVLPHDWGNATPNFLGGINVSETLTTSGSRAIHRTNVTAAALTLDETYEVVSCNTNGANNIVVTLPTAASANGRRYTIHRTGANDAGFTVTVQKSGSDAVAEAGHTVNSFVLAFGEYVELISDGGTLWYISDSYGITAVPRSPVVPTPAANTTYLYTDSSGRYLNTINGKGPFRPHTEYDIHEYGIAQDNTGDAGAALNAASAAAATNGGVVVLGPGIYTATTAIIWPVGVSLRGAGRDISKVFISGLGSSTDGITFGAIGTTFAESGGFFRDLTIAAASTSDCRDVLAFVNWNSMEFQNVQVYGGGRYGANMYSVQNINWSHCQISNAVSAGLLIDGATPEGVATTNRFISCSFQNTATGPGVDFRRCDTTDFISCQYTSNGFAASNTAGIGFKMGTSSDSSHGSRARIIGGHFEANYGYDIYASGSVPSVLRLTVVDPLINAINDKSGGSNGMVYLDGVTGGSWTGGTFNDGTGTGAIRFRITANTKAMSFSGLPQIDTAHLDYDSGGGHTIRDYPGVFSFFNGDDSKMVVMGNFDLHTGTGTTPAYWESNAADTHIGFINNAKNFSDPSSTIAKWQVAGTDRIKFDYYGGISCDGIFATSDYWRNNDQPLGLKSNKADGSSAVGGFFDAVNGFVTGGSNLWEWRNGGSRVAYIDKDGSFVTSAAITLGNGNLWGVSDIHWGDGSLQTSAYATAKGLATLSAGSVTISNSQVNDSTSVILLSYNCQAGDFVNLGTLYVGGIANGSSFTINSTNPLDDNTVSWALLN